MALTPTKKKKILDQYNKEKKASMKSRQRFSNAWLSNESLYNGQSANNSLTRSQLHVPKVFEAVHTASARMGRMPTIEYDTKNEDDENAHVIMKYLWEYDVRRSRLDELFRLSKTEAGLYSRGIIKLIPGNDGNKFKLVDTLSFLISPIATSIRVARNCGEQFIYKTIAEIEAEADTFEYEPSEIKKMKDDHAAREILTNKAYNEDQSVRNTRLQYLGLSDTSNIGVEVVELTEWYTYLENNTPYVLTVANDKYLLRAVPIKEVGLPAFPYASYATYPRGTTFWTPSVADIHRDPNLATNVILNQQIDNNTYRNFGMMFVDGGSGLSQSAINPRPLGITKINTNGGKIKDRVWQYVPPEISSSMATMNTVNQIADNASGISNFNPTKKGKSSVTEIATNNAVVEEKGNDFKDSILVCFEDLAQLYADSIKMNLTEPRKVKIYGRTEMTLQGVTKANFKGVDFIARAESQETATETKVLRQKAAQSVFEALKDDPQVPGQRFLRENLMKQYGFTEDQIEKAMKQEGGQMGQPQQPQVQPQGGQMPENPNAPLLGQTQQIAQSNAQ